MNIICRRGLSRWSALKRRLYLVEKLRDARTFGLVIGTVGVEGYREAVQRVRQLARRASKKVYVISVGKVNVAKLSNFSADIDCFVLLSCPFGVLLDTSSFDKPLLSLFEAEIALNPTKEWCATAGWTSEFVHFVHDEIPDEKKYDKDKTDVSLVSGRIRNVQVTEKFATEDSGTVAVYTAGDYFANRTWKGLDVSLSEEAESLQVQQGRSGRAALYENEPGSC